MSGPKSSRYTLTAEQRRILEEQRRIEAAKAVANETIKRGIANLRRLSDLSQQDNEFAREAIARLGNDSGYSKKIGELDCLVKESEMAASNTDTTNLSSLESTAKSISENVKKAEQIKREIQKIVSLNEKNLRADIAKTFNENFSVSFADIEPKAVDSSKMLIHRKSEISDKIRDVKKNGIISNELYAELEKAEILTEDIYDLQFLKNHISINVNPLLKRCAEYEELYQAHHEEYEALYSEYTALCGLYHYVVQEYPFSVESMSILKEEIERIKITAEQQSEKAYIQQALDEVMKDMGYCVLGSREVTKRNGTKFHSELYTFGEGTAVNVTYSPDGRIAMELGGLDNIDRIPNDTESAVLCGEMQDFCDDFKEIEKRLLAKGVIVAEHISMFPPDVAYAQIINTSDYDMQLQTSSFNTESHRGKAAEKKKMKVE